MGDAVTLVCLNCGHPHKEGACGWDFGECRCPVHVEAALPGESRCESRLPPYGIWTPDSYEEHEIRCSLRPGHHGTHRCVREGMSWETQP